MTLAGLLSTRDGSTFLNPKLMAPNVFEIDIDPDVIAELAPLAEETKAMEETGGYTLSNGVRLDNVRPTHWHSDICWLGHADEAAFTWFEALYHRLGLGELVARYVPHDRKVTLYAGFFITRSRCDELDMHCDWVTEDNQAFTLMAPLTANASELGMTYNTVRGETRELRYQVGKGLVFGTKFLHSTAVGQLPERSAFLCLNFGTDRMEKWQSIGSTTATQAKFLRQPDGIFTSRAEWKRRYGEPSAY